MRQGQQNRRGRGRNNNNNNNNSNSGSRKSQNPLTRSFESNGPDMKIRGTPAHIAEKYMALARDAHSSGDPVLAENYLQHAEHYNRIILAYREQQLSQGAGDPGGIPRPRHFSDSVDGTDEFGDEQAPDFVDPGQQAQPRVEAGPQPAAQPQPRAFDAPRYDDRSSRGQNESFGRGSRGDRDRSDRGDRGERQDRYESRDGGRSERQERSERYDHRQDRPERGEQPRGFTPQPAAAEAAEQPPPREQTRRRDRFPQPHEQPEFLRRSVRRPRREAAPEGASEAPVPAPADDGATQD